MIHQIRHALRIFLTILPEFVLEKADIQIFELFTASQDSKVSLRRHTAFITIRKSRVPSQAHGDCS